MTKELETLYSVFDLLNGEDISHSPSMSNTEHTYYNRFLEVIPKWIQGTMVNKWTVSRMKKELEETNHCYYQPSQIREPVRINNCPYIKICDKLLKELKNE